MTELQIIIIEVEKIFKSKLMDFSNALFEVYCTTKKTSNYNKLLCKDSTGALNMGSEDRYNLEDISSIGTVEIDHNLSPQVKETESCRVSVRYPEQAVGILSDWIKKNSNSKGPDLSERCELAAKCGLTERQVAGWMINAKKGIKLGRQVARKGFISRTKAR